MALTRARDLLLVSGVGALNPKTPPGLSTDLARLASALGHGIPLGGERDETLELSQGSAYRLRVIIPDVAEAAAPPEDILARERIPAAHRRASDLGR